MATARSLMDRPAIEVSHTFPILEQGDTGHFFIGVKGIEVSHFLFAFAQITVCLFVHKGRHEGTVRTVASYDRAIGSNCAVVDSDACDDINSKRRIHF